MSEPAVTLTDYGLFVECAAFAWLIARRPANRGGPRFWVVLFFSCTALAALLGGTVHGFFPGEAAGVGRVLWKLSMLAIGATALAGWVLAARLLWAAHIADRLVMVGIGLTTVYAAVILLVSDAFWVALAGYIPAAALLFAGFARAAARWRASWATLGAWGLGLSFAAAAVQQLRIAVHPQLFDHNALYHLMQAVALALIFVACRAMLDSHGGLYVDTA